MNTERLGHFRMQGLDPVRQDLRETGELGNFLDRNPVVPEQFRGAARRNNLESQPL